MKLFSDLDVRVFKSRDYNIQKPSIYNDLEAPKIEKALVLRVSTYKCGKTTAVESSTINITKKDLEWLLFDE
jgi:hypothetical protein